MRYVVPLCIAAIVVVGIVLFFYFRNSSSPAARVGTSKQGRVMKTDEEWKAILTEEQFRITRRKGTERAFTGKYATTKADGIYHCVCCDQPLFDSRTKYDSGTGWPSYWQPIDENCVSLVSDHSGWSQRTEVICSRCDAHLGHVFEDGPPPTGLRYCMNSAALKLVEPAKSTDERP
jgi:peptide-methionine (R)-S-oxide reductase